jgi:HAMP domain-containing protein
MNSAAIIAIIEEVLGAAVTLAPSAIKLEQVIQPLAQGLWDHLVNKKVITQDDIDALKGQIAATSSRIQAPLPPAQDDDV